MNSPDSLPTISEPALMNRLEDEIKSETGIFSTSLSKKVKVTVDDDLFGSVTVTPKARKADSDEDDLFAPTPSSRPKPSAKTKPPSQPTTTASVFDNPPEDIFAPSLGSRQEAVGADDIFASDKPSNTGKKLDDLLASPSRKGATLAKEGVEETDGVKVREC